MDNIIKDKYQLNTILDIYGGRDNNQTTYNAFQYYINHNNLPNSVQLSDRVIPVNGMHAITNTYYYFPGNNYGDELGGNSDSPYCYFYPILSYNFEDNVINNNYKLISAKDIDFENAYLKYAKPSYNYDDPISYYDLSLDDNGKLVVKECNTGYTYSFNRDISPYINNSYDLLNIVDYLLNRVNCLNFLIEIIKEQKNVAN